MAKHVDVPHLQRNVRSHASPLVWYSEITLRFSLQQTSYCGSTLSMTFFLKYLWVKNPQVVPYSIRLSVDEIVVGALGRSMQCLPLRIWCIRHQLDRLLPCITVATAYVWATCKLTMRFRWYWTCSWVPLKPVKHQWPQVADICHLYISQGFQAVSYTHLRAHET